MLFSSCGSHQPEATNAAGAAFSDTAGKGGPENIGNRMLAPCKWSFQVEFKNRNEATLISTATIDSGWHLYSQHINDGSLAMEFNYDDSPGYNLIGKTEEGQSLKESDPYLKIEIRYFEKKAVFRQKIRILSNENFRISGTINYKACLTQCVTSEEDFSFNIRRDATGKYQ